MALQVQIEGRDFQLRAALPLNGSVDSLRVRLDGKSAALPGNRQR